MPSVVSDNAAPVASRRVGLDTPAHLLRARRERLLADVGEGVVVLPASPAVYRSGDSAYRYRPDSDLAYLTGFSEPGAVAVLTPHDNEHRFTLFLRERDEKREVWDGRRVGVDAAPERFGADAAYPIGELDERLPDLLKPADRILYALGSHREMDRRITRQLVRFRGKRARAGKGPTGLEDPGRLLHPMRLRKDSFELVRMREAAGIAAEAHRAAMRAAAPGRGEWELEAALELAFRSRGASGAAYAPIVGSGPNATVLHYVDNDRVMRDGELVLIDAGAELGLYASDITRTFPVNGRFSGPQRTLYDLVLSAEEAGIAAIRPGATADAPHEAALAVLVEGMIDLGLLRGPAEERIENRDYRRFFMHRTSHWLGMDTHDVGPYIEDGEPVRFEPGMVLTVEPGLYVSADADDVPDAYRGLGIRIEDDVAVTGHGHEVWTRGVPVDPTEIEALMSA